MANDGSLIFDTGIDTSKFSRGTAEIKKKAEDTAKRVEKAVAEAEAAAERAANATDAKTKKTLEAAAQNAKRAADKIIAEAQQVEKELTESMNRSAKSQADFVSGLNKGVKTAAAGIVAAGAAVIGTGVKYNSEIEQYAAGFETMLGSAEKADELLGNLKSFAEKTPFEMSDLAGASTTLLAFGEDVNDLMPDLKMLGDISLGNKEKFDGLALVFGQVRSQGKLMGQDLLQMINQGFNPLQVISKKTGESMASLKDKMSKGEISFEMVADAMRSATSAGGQFYNAMEKQSQTFLGQSSTLADGIKSLFGEMSEGVSQELTENVLPAAIEKVEELKQAWTDGELEEGIGVVIGLLTGVGTAAAGLNLVNMITDIQNVIKLGEQYNTVTKAGAAAQKLLNAEILMNPYAIAAVALAALTAGVIAYGMSVKSETEKVTEVLRAENEERDRQREKIEEAREARAESAAAGMAEMEYVSKLSDELSGLADANGRVQDKDKARAAFILGELNSALGTEYQMVGNVIQGYNQLCESIDKVIAKKKFEILSDSMSEDYANAIEQQKTNILKMAEYGAEIERVKAELTRIINTPTDSIIGFDVTAYAEMEKYLQEVTKAYDDYKDRVVEDSKIINTYQDAQTKNLEGNIQGAIDSLQNFIVASNDAYEQQLEAAAGNAAEEERIIAEKYTKSLEKLAHYAEEYAKGTEGYTAEGLAVLQQAALDAQTEAESIGLNIVNGVLTGLSGFQATIKPVIDRLAGLIPEWLRDVLKINSPSKAVADVTEGVPEGAALGIERATPIAERATKALAEDMIDIAAGNVNKNATEIGINLTAEIAGGIAKGTLRAEEAVKKLRTKLDRQRELELISEEEYYKELEKLRDEYFIKESDDWYDYTKKIYDYQKNVLEEQKRDIESMYSDIASYTTSKIEEVISKQEGYRNRLNSISSIFDTTTLQLGDKTITTYTMHDFSRDIEAISRYSEKVSALKDRMGGLGFSDSDIDAYMTEFDNLDINTAMQFIDSVMGSSDSLLKQSIEGYVNSRRLSEKTAAGYYEEDMKAAADEAIGYMEQKLKEAGFNDIPEGFFISGQISAEKFGDAFLSELDIQMEEIREKISAFNASLAVPAGAQAQAAGAAGTVSTSNYSTVYNLLPAAGESTRQQLETFRREETLKKMRGGY